MLKKRCGFHGVLLAVVAWAFTVPGFGWGAEFPQKRAPETVITAGWQVEKELNPGESHTFEIDLAAEDFVSMQINQSGIDVQIQVIGPQENLTVQVNYLERDFGPEPVFWIASVAGTYRIEISPVRQNPKPGKYHLRFQTKRSATPTDREQLATRQTFNRAFFLSQSDDSSVWAEAISLFQTAAARFHSGGNAWFEGAALFRMGRSQLQTGKIFPAIETFDQAKAQFQSCQDFEAVAAANKELALLYQATRQNTKAIETLNEVLEYGRNFHRTAWEAEGYYQLATVFENFGEVSVFFGQFAQALKLFRQIGDKRGEAFVLARFSRLYRLWNENQKAELMVNQSLEIFRSLGDSQGKRA